MKIQIILLALIVGCAYCEGTDVTIEDGILVLTDDNFDVALETHEHILVMFYAPWCGHCKKLKPEFSIASMQLMDDGSEIKLAKVDCTVEKVLAGKFEVQGYPTLKFFIGGSAIAYNGPREANGIVTWVNKKTQPASSLVEDQESLEKAKTDNSVVVVFFGEETSEDFATWQKVSLAFDDFQFFHVFDSALAAEYGVEGTGVSLFKQFDEGRNDFEGDSSVDALTKFIEDNSVATIMAFDQKAAQLIFGGGKSCFFLFKDGGEASQAAMDALETASSKLKGSILMAHSGVEDGLDKRVADYIGITGDLPQVWIVDPAGGDISKFQMSGDVTSESMVAFFQDFQAGKLESYVKSEPIPEQDQDVFQIVGLNWEDVVLDQTKDVLVKYYAPWCGHCKSMKPGYEEVARNVAVHKNLVIAEMDATANEVAGLNIQGFPTLKFYPSNNKTPLDYDGDRDVAGFMAYLKEHTSRVVDWSATEEETAEETEEVVAEEAEEEAVRDEL